MFLFSGLPMSRLLASTLIVALASTTLADDVFVEKGVVVKPLSKRKQRKLEKKLARRPGNEVVIEGTPTATPSPEAIAGVKSRRALRPLFGDRFNRRNDVVVGPSVVTAPSVGVVTNSSSTIVATPSVRVAPGDPLVVPGSVEVTPTPRAIRPPVVSTPRNPARPADPDDEPMLEPERPVSVRVLPPPADEIPAPIVSTPRKPLAPAAPAPMPAPTPVPESALPPVDPGPGEPTSPPRLEPPLEPRPA